MLLLAGVLLSWLSFAASLDMSLYGAVTIFKDNTAISGNNATLVKDGDDFFFSATSNSFSFAVSVAIDEVNEKLPSLTEVDEQGEPVNKDDQCLHPTFEGTIEGEYGQEDDLVVFFGCQKVGGVMFK